jgi:hypothetical protein
MLSQFPTITSGSRPSHCGRAAWAVAEGAKAEMSNRAAQVVRMENIDSS